MGEPENEALAMVVDTWLHMGIGMMKKVDTRRAHAHIKGSTCVLLMGIIKDWPGDMRQCISPARQNVVLLLLGYYLYNHDGSHKLGWATYSRR